jgi:hypothetical protein
MRLARYTLTTALALLLAGAAHAQQRTSPPSTIGITPTFQYAAPLFRNQDVVRDLNLTPDQINRLSQETNRLQTRYSADYNRLNDRDRPARVRELMRTYDEQWLRSAGKVLNQQQLDRYRQLQLQNSGFEAFSDPDVQRRLALTEEQQQQLRQLSEQMARERPNVPTGDRSRVDDGLRRWRDYQDQARERTNRILNERQLQMWREMTGAPYTLPPTGPTPAPGGTGR